jgi:porin
MKKRDVSILMCSMVFTGLYSVQTWGVGIEAPVEREVEEREGILPAPDFSGTLGTRNYLTGDWDGVRNELSSRGIQVDAEFMQYVQMVADGGVDRSAAWGGKQNYMLHLDLQKMGLVPGALVYVRFDGRWGRSSFGRTGQLLPGNEASLVPVDFEELDRETAATMTAFNYTQFLSKKFGIVVGKMDNMDGDFNEFAGGRGDSQFMNYNLIYAAPTAIVPASVLGAGVIYMLNPNVTLVSQVLSATDSSFSSGFDTMDDGFMSVNALMTQYRLADLPGGFNATYIHWFDTDFTDTSSFIAVPDEGVVSSDENTSWLFAMSAWQYLYTEEPSKGLMNPLNKKPDLQGWGVFARVGLADKKTNPMHNSYSVGIGGRGIFPTRDNDVYGIGYFYTDLRPEAMESNFGTPLNIKGDFQGSEIFYSIALTPAVKLTFDVQFLESYDNDIDNSTVLGSRFQMIF